MGSLPLASHGRVARRVVWVAAFAALCATAAPAPAQMDDDAEMRRVFQEILRDPTNPGLNFRYARLATARGEYRKALAAYERVLARDPSNAEARAGIQRILQQTEPSYTNITVVVGGQYESNPRHQRNRTNSTGDGALTAQFNFSDERRLFNLPFMWRTEADGSLLYYATMRDVNLVSIGARTGPVFTVARGLKVNPFIGLFRTWLDRHSLSLEPTAGVMVESEVTGPLKSVTARWGFVGVGRTYSERDGTFVEVYPTLEFRNLGLQRSLTIVTPYWRYNGVIGSGALTETPENEPYPARQHQLGGRVDYFVPILAWLTGNVNFTYEYRHYFERIPLETKNRRDHIFAPGAQLIFGSFLENQVDVIASYLFEYRQSNDGNQRYLNHTASVRVVWRM
jgi:hypothetical protein